MKRLHNLAYSAMVVAFVLMIIASSLQIITRYILRSPLLGAEELARLFGVWLYFLGASCAVITREHITIDIVYLRVSPRAQKVFRLISDGLLFVFHVIVLVEGIKFASFSYNFESSSLRFSMSFFAAALPVSALLILILLVHSAWNELRGTPTSSG